MSESPKAILAYGYDLGGSEFGWNFTYKPASRFRHVLEGNRFASEAIENFILQENGFVEDPQVHVQGYWARRTAALRETGVQIVRYGSPEYPGYILACEVFDVDDYGSKNLRIADFQVNLLKASKLTQVYNQLGVIPTHNPNPNWVLAAYYG